VDALVYSPAARRYRFARKSGSGGDCDAQDSRKSAQKPPGSDVERDSPRSSS